MLHCARSAGDCYYTDVSAHGLRAYTAGVRHSIRERLGTARVSREDNTGSHVTAQVISEEEARQQHQRPSRRLPRASLRSLGYSWSALAMLHRRRDLLLVLLAAALPRLWRLGQTVFLDDQSALLALGRSALAHYALPATGIRSSIGTLNFPASIYVLLPFAVLPDPFWAALATALANVAAVGLLFLVVKRYAGRRTALFAALLYATAPWAVYFSRFAWQQNLLAPVVVLFFWTACLGVVERRRGWLPWNLLLGAVAVQLHPSAAPLFALTLAALWLTRHRLSRRELLLGAAALALPFLPTVLWELATGGSDIAAYAAFGAQSSVVDGQVFRTLLTVLTPPDHARFDASTPYAGLFDLFGWARVALVALYVAAAGWLLGALLRRRGELAAEADDGAHGPIVPMGQALRPPAGFLLLLVLWQAAILLVLVRHPKSIAEHYLLAVLPAIFLTMGLFLGWLAERLELASTLSREALHLAARRLPAAGLVALAAAQMLASGAFVASMAQVLPDGRQAFAYMQYGIPLDAQQAALRATLAVARANHARAYVATTAGGQPGFGYLAATGPAPRPTVYDAGACLIVPAAGSSPAVVLATEPLPADGVLAALAGVRSHVIETGWNGSPLRLYTLPAGVTAPGETPISPAAASSGLRLAAFQYQALADGATPRLLLRWAGQPPAPSSAAADLAYWRGALPGSGGVGSYTFAAQPVDAAGTPLGPALMATCPVLHWGAGEAVYTWIPLPRTLTTLPTASSVAGWHVWVERQMFALARPHIGPLALESGDLALGPVERLPGATTLTLAGGG